MSINKKVRELVYAKFEGKCGYCGNHMEYKDMQVDHIQPQRSMGTDGIDNLMPACRLCNPISEVIHYINLDIGC